MVIRNYHQFHNRTNRTLGGGFVKRMHAFLIVKELKYPLIAGSPLLTLWILILCVELVKLLFFYVFFQQAIVLLKVISM